MWSADRRNRNNCLAHYVKRVKSARNWLLYSAIKEKTFAVISKFNCCWWRVKIIKRAGAPPLLSASLSSSTLILFSAFLLLKLVLIMRTSLFELLEGASYFLWGAVKNKRLSFYLAGFFNNICILSEVTILMEANRYFYYQYVKFFASCVFFFKFLEFRLKTVKLLTIYLFGDCQQILWFSSWW